MSIADDISDTDPNSFIKDFGAGPLHLRKRVTVGILGATGCVGQQLVLRLSAHPWFTITALAASQKQNGKTYREAVTWRIEKELDDTVGNLIMQPLAPNLPCDLIFSALDGSIAGEVEMQFKEAGYPVISCAKNHRMDPKVPLLIPEVNEGHLELIKNSGEKGMIITKPNCTAVGLALALRPLQLEFGIDAVHVCTLQALSGAGFAGVENNTLVDNVIPYIAGEEERLELEPHKILGEYNNGVIENYPMTISSTCTRVPVLDGHLELVSVKLKEKASKEQVIRAWNEFQPSVQELKLPSACTQIIHYFQEPEFPQPKLHRDLEKGMAISIGRLRQCPLFDYKFVLLSHNTVRGAAGGAVMIAELLVKRGYIFW